MLQLIVAILSLLLLAGAFGAGTNADEKTPVTATENTGKAHEANHGDSTP